MTVLIFGSYYYLLSTVVSEKPSCKILLSFVMGCAQIVMTELLLGLSHGLLLPPLVIVNGAIAGLVLTTGYRLGNRPFLPVLKTDMIGLKQSWTAAQDGYTIVLGILVLATYGWIATASWYLPPRGIDDLAYHLPPVFEYIRSHEIRLLPVELRHHFAFPENAELLFLWPTIFAGNQKLVDSVNIPFVLVSVLTIHALLRHFRITGKDALFASLLYALCPVVMFQAGVNYIDIIVSLFFLLSLYFSVLFHAHGSRRYLFAAGIAIGLMLGMKYTAILLALPLQVLILPGLFRSTWRNRAAYGAAIVALCGWWYARNLFVLQDPFYPLNFLGPLLGTAGGGGGVFRNIGINARHWASRYLIADIGIGSYDGGFGLVFWGVGFSSWLCYGAHALVNARRVGLARLVVLACLPIGFLLLLAIPEEDIPYVARMAMFVVAVGLFSFCETMKLLDDKLCASLLKGTCTVLSILSLGLLFDSTKPHYKLGNVIADRANRNYPSEFRYVSNAPRTTRAAHGFVWECLDFLTRDKGNGLLCHIITDPPFFAPAPVYGSTLQNRVAYSLEQAHGTIEAYVCTYYGGFKNSRLDGKTSSHDILASSDYVVAAHWDYGCLILHRKIFRDVGKQQLLENYYRSTWPEAVAAAAHLTPLLTEQIPLVTSSQVGYGVRCLDMQAHGTERVTMTPNGLEELVATRRSIGRCYTLSRPLTGYRCVPIGRVAYHNADLTIYLNWKP